MQLQHVPVYWLLMAPYRYRYGTWRKTKDKKGGKEKIWSVRDLEYAGRPAGGGRGGGLQVIHIQNTIPLLPDRPPAGSVRMSGRPKVPPPPPTTGTGSVYGVSVFTSNIYTGRYEAGQSQEVCRSGSNGKTDWEVVWYRIVYGSKNREARAFQHKH